MHEMKFQCTSSVRMRSALSPEEFLPSPARNRLQKKSNGDFFKYGSIQKKRQPAAAAKRQGYLLRTADAGRMMCDFPDDQWDFLKRKETCRFEIDCCFPPWAHLALVSTQEEVNSYHVTYAGRTPAVGAGMWGQEMTSCR